MASDLLMLLPPELIRLLLHELVPTGSLLSALLASSYLNRVFEGDKVWILSKVVRETVHPSLLCDAVAAVSPLPNDPQVLVDAQIDQQMGPILDDVQREKAIGRRDHSGRYEKWLVGMENMVGTYLRQRRDNQVLQDLPLPVTIPLCRLLRSMEGLSSLFAARAWRNFQNFGYQELEYADAEYHPPNDTFRPLSRVERARMYRALFRIQICSNLFHGMPKILYDPAKPVHHYKGHGEVKGAIENILRQFLPWENEELVTAHQLLSWELANILEAVQSRFVERIIVEELEKHKSTNPRQDRFDKYSLGTIDANRFASHDIHFSEASKSHKTHHVNYLISKGLNFLFSLTRVNAWDTPQQEQIIVRSHGRIPESLADIITSYSHDPRWDWAWDRDQQSDIRWSAPNDRRGDNLIQSNEAYLWAVDYPLPDRRASSPAFRFPRHQAFAATQDSILRQCGYVFWDNERSFSMGLSQRRRRQRVRPVPFSVAGLIGHQF